MTPQQLHAVFTLPPTWKQTPDKAPDKCPSLHPHPSLTLCPMNHLFLFRLASPASAWSSSLTSSPPCQSSPTHQSLGASLLQSFFLVLLASLCFLPSQSEAAWFRVGVVGPWGCDPLFAKALPDVAAQLAVNRINKDPSLSYAVTFDYIVLQVHS